MKFKKLKEDSGNLINKLCIIALALSFHCSFTQSLMAFEIEGDIFCGVGQPGMPEEKVLQVLPMEKQRLLITFESAKIAPKKSNNETWDEPTSLGGVLGKNLPAPDPYLKIKSSKGSKISESIAETFEPKWNFKVPFSYSSEKTLNVQIWEKDSHGNEHVGRTTLNGAQDFCLGIHETGPFGQVLKLRYIIELPEYPLKEWKAHPNLSESKNSRLKEEYLKKKANQSSCYNNQKKLKDALKMYKADHGKYPDKLNITTLRKLEKEGYLMTIPQDPGAERGGSANYQIDSKNRVSCKVHGRASSRGTK